MRQYACRSCRQTFDTTSKRGPLPMRCPSCRDLDEPDRTPPGVPSPEYLQTQDRGMEALEMRRQGHTYDEIASTLGLVNAKAAGLVVRTAMERRDHRMDSDVDWIRRQEQQRLEMLVMEAFGVLQATHVVTSGGTVVTHNGNVLIDHGPTLAAIETLRKLSESRRKMLGLDAATKLASDTSVTYKIEGISEDEMP